MSEYLNSKYPYPTYVGIFSNTKAELISKIGIICFHSWSPALWLGAYAFLAVPLLRMDWPGLAGPGRSGWSQASWLLMSLWLVLGSRASLLVQGFLARWVLPA